MTTSRALQSSYRDLENVRPSTDDYSSTRASRSALSPNTFMLPLGESHGNRPSPCPSTASATAKSTRSAFFSPPASSISLKSNITSCSSPPSSADSVACHDMHGHSSRSTQTEEADAYMRSHTSKSSQTTSSPSKLARLPSLDIIAARLKNVALNSEQMHSHSAEPVDADNRASTSAFASPSKRGRSEVLATLRERTANRSRSTSPVKTMQKSPVEHQSAFSHIPTLDEIAQRIARRDSNAGLPQLKTNGNAAPVVTASPQISAPPSPTPIHNLANGLPPGYSSEFLTPSKTRSKAQAYAEWRKTELARRPTEHPLQHTWGMYFDCKMWAATGSPSKGTTANSEQPHDAHAWESVLRLLGHYVTVESFTSVFRTLRRPSQVERNSSYHLFKNGIKPMWEDPANANGGKWVLTLRGGNAALLDRSWMWLVLALVGEDLDEDDDITGAVVSTRPKGDRIALWIREKAPVEKINRIGRRFVELLEMQDEPGVTLEFSPNSSAGNVPDHAQLMRIDNPLARSPEPSAMSPPLMGAPMTFSRTNSMSGSRPVMQQSLAVPLDTRQTRGRFAKSIAELTCLCRPGHVAIKKLCELIACKQ